MPKEKVKRPKVGDAVVFIDPIRKQEYTAVVTGFTLDDEGNPVQDFRIDLRFDNAKHKDDGPGGRQELATGVPHERETGMEETRCWVWPDAKGKEE